jgi:hypothetical protein
VEDFFEKDADGTNLRASSSPPLKDLDCTSLCVSAELFPKEADETSLCPSEPAKGFAGEEDEEGLFEKDEEGVMRWSSPSPVVGDFVNDREGCSRPSPPFVNDGEGEILCPSLLPKEGMGDLSDVPKLRELGERGGEEVALGAIGERGGEELACAPGKPFSLDIEF